MTSINTSNLHVVIGLGATGYSCVRYLHKQGIPVAVTDTRPTPPFLEQLQKNYPDVHSSLGRLDEELLKKAAKIVISPGLSLHEPAIAAQMQKGIPVIGDIELFAQAVKAPVIAITGTNAKSTVTTLVGMMAEQFGLNVEVGGNLGVPALDLLQTTSKPDLFVLELSSFQLETTFSLAPKVATVLNVTPDHMDRYATVEDYLQAKLRIYKNCEVAVANLDDPKTECKTSARKLFFTLGKPGPNQFGLSTKDRKPYLAFEDKLLMPVNELPVAGRHYQANALAALALGYGAGFSLESMLQVLKDFRGLPHRCQFIRKRQGVNWYNDSKGTNVGATVAAIEGLGAEMSGRLILIAGGVGKNADFSPLVPTLEKYVRTVVLLGEAAPDIAQAIGDKIKIVFAKDMSDAVEKAAIAAASEDSVLLSPACASFDMFKNYEHRGEVFMTLVQGLT